MGSFSKLVVSLGLVGLTTSSAWAQGAVNLIRNKGVQQELKVPEEQSQRIATAAAEIRRRQREEMTNLADLAPSQERGEKIRKLLDTLEEDFSKNLADILTPEQSRRFEQIKLQSAGASALGIPRVEKALKLTDDQKGKIREINEALAASLKGLPPEETRLGERSEMVTDLRQNAKQRAFAVLTDGQKKAWASLTGDAFEVKY